MYNLTIDQMFRHGECDRVTDQEVPRSDEEEEESYPYIPCWDTER